MKKIILTDTSEVFCRALLEALGDGYRVHICTDGLKALEMLEEFQPDALVTDLTLPGVDGLTLLRAAAELTNRPVLLVAARLYTPFVEAALDQIGVDYAMRKPCNVSCLAERIGELCCPEEQIQSVPYTATDTDALLAELRLNVCRDGYGYLKRIIELYRQNPGWSMTKELYPAAGQPKHASALAVERAVRSVIEDAWSRRDEDVWRMYFSADPQGHVPRPTNKEFVVAMAIALRYQQRKWA